MVIDQAAALELQLGRTPSLSRGGLLAQKPTTVAHLRIWAFHFGDDGNILTLQVKQHRNIHVPIRCFEKVLR